MEVQERKQAKIPSKSKSSKRHPSSSSDPHETKTKSKPHPNPTSPNPNGDPPPVPAARKKPNPNPNPKPPKPSPSSTILPKSPTKSSKPHKPETAVMPDDPSSDPASPSRKSDRKRKARDFSDEEPSGKSSQAGQRRLADDNAVTLLRAAIDFRSGTGSIPLPSNMGIFYDFVKASLPTPLTKEQVYNKLRHLRHKFQKSSSPGSGPNDGLVHDLCTEVWGAVDKKDDNKEERRTKEGTLVPAIKNGDAAAVVAEEDEEQPGNGEERGVHGLDSLPYMSSAAAEHWKANELWGVSWEAGLKRMDPSKARVLEEKWRRQLGDEMKLQMDWSKTSRELLALLNDAYKVSHVVLPFLFKVDESLCERLVQSLAANASKAKD